MHKGRRPLHCREFPEISIQTHAFERLCHSLLREPQQNEFAVNLCRIARLRVAAQLFRLRWTTPWQAAAAGFTLATPISAPVCAYGLPGRKKGNQISLVAFVKPGGGRTNLTYDISTLTMTKLFQVWWWFYFREIFPQIFDQAENFGRLFIFL